MKFLIPAFIAGTSLLAAAPARAQMSGTSHPEALNDVITTSPAPALRPHPTETLMVAPAPTPQPPVETAAAVRPALQQTTPAVRIVAAPPVIDPADAGIVTAYPYSPTSLLDGTLIKARLNEKISTVDTKSGTRFTARLSQNVEHDGAVILPVGAILSGRITSVRGGHRIHGSAAIHIEPETITLPDGSFYNINAQVIDLDQFHNSKVNAEGTILRNDHPKETLAVLGGITGTAAVTGAVAGGVPGALIGAGVGAGVSTVWWLKQDRQETLSEGTQIVFSLTRPLNLTPIAK